MEERTCDIIVLGGGPAGMTAAIYAKRANLDVVLLETNVTGGLVNSTLKRAPRIATTVRCSCTRMRL